MQLLENILGEDASMQAMDALNREVEWHEVHLKGYLVPRLVSIQGEIKDGHVPVYRHPMDDEPPVVMFSETVDMIRKKLMVALETQAGLSFAPFNHVLIQKYRDGDDCIGDHADKTLDIDQNSVIVNYSLGQVRTMRLRRKSNPRKVAQQFDLFHDSMFVLDLEDNRVYKHGVEKDSDEEERKMQGERISLTFRTISTFWNIEKQKLVGQGAPKEYNPALVHMGKERNNLLKKFSLENDVDYTWKMLYKEGSPYTFVDYAARYPLVKS